jgi:hypothetical protein
VIESIYFQTKLIFKDVNLFHSSTNSLTCLNFLIAFTCCPVSTHWGLPYLLISSISMTECTRNDNRRHHCYPFKLHALTTNKRLCALKKWSTVNMYHKSVLKCFWSIRKVVHSVICFSQPHALYYSQSVYIQSTQNRNGSFSKRKKERNGSTLDLAPKIRDRSLE